MKTMLSGLFLSAGLLAFTPAAVYAATPATPEKMNRIYAEYWEEYSKANPILATFNGDNRYNDRFGAVTSKEAIAETRRLAEKYLARTAL